jgi:hypothetical protein
MRPLRRHEQHSRQGFLHSVQKGSPGVPASQLFGINNQSRFPHGPHPLG